MTPVSRGIAGTRFRTDIGGVHQDDELPYLFSVYDQFTRMAESTPTNGFKVPLKMA